jgi:tripartite-type tricarboxylate transporter receptor subunit TctC
MKLTRRDTLRLAGAALALPALPRAAQAENWPTRPIRAVIPFTAGSTIDVIGRIALDPLSAQLGQPIVVENRGGAGGSIGAALVAKAEPDGYTLLVHASAHSAAPAVYPNLSYDAVRDFSAVAALGAVPNVTVISPDKGIRSLKELVARAKAGSMSYASAGAGSATHFAAERLRISAGFNAVHVPFRGAESLTEVMAGRVDFMCAGVSGALPFLMSGKLIPLAVSTPKRSSALPNVPTTLEEGFANSDYYFWNGILVPSKTPRAIVDRLHRETMKALKNPKVVENFKKQGIEPMPLSPTEFDALIKKEVADNIAMVKTMGMKIH